jgi:cellulose synthase/poly-beta-1,6-N-acetylglucosamine synthase-like glycosyltransferase
MVSRLGAENNSLVILVNSYPINKPFSLNQGLLQAKNKIITIFDAEDEPHSEIYNVVNTVLVKEKVDVVQSGVQLMNYNSNWFSTLNVLEYFLWFKSGLQFFTDIGKVSILGGNTVFFKKSYLNKIGGWDENSLTEDADIGIRLTLAGAKTKVIYDERHVTKEETPSNIDSFIKQRTRWNQGFWQIMLKGDWLKLPTLKQRLVAGYILMAPYIPILLFAYILFGIWISFTNPVPVFITLIAYTPFYILVAIICLQIFALWEFTKFYNLKYYWYLPFKLVITFFPYMAILAFSSVRSLIRLIINSNSWEKTIHLNTHRITR